ncbi:alpha/beta hydrolase [Paeniglutamicibacter psychrophenolicus]|uniref:Pimeloyl-ACP methyl ester carboxylesterase n=1 Tax=Paeniglutamicibacter psychrophenolicus TaxID=257454 RepID=A0ABS4WBZ1_9MICC|nr:alpha/beta hydrolase [Paeniglutamicibacter psychrophenolicus]MBP2373710.1 pimeloyl-ACP methyl ester carboxylesterase [Paeniglutamicibacter psychrophenolicus]
MDINTGSAPAASGIGHIYIDLPGVRLHIAEAGAGTPLLLLHGVPQDASVFNGMIPALAEGHRVIALDTRGFGQSSMPATGYALDTQVADLVGLLDALGVDKTRILAHDLGAVYAMMLCLAHPERVHSLVSLSIPHLFLRFNLAFLPLFKNAWFDPVLAIPGMARLLMGSGRQVLARYMFNHFVHDPGCLDPEQVEAYLARLREPGRAAALGALYRQCVMPTFIKLMRGGYLDQRLTVPTLLAVGEHDEAMSASLLEGYEPYADALELVRIPGAAHFVVDEQPGAVLAMAREFFARPGH